MDTGSETPAFIREEDGTVSEPLSGDFPATRASPGRVQILGVAAGNIFPRWDVDVFATDLTANITYQIDMEGQHLGGNDQLIGGEFTEGGWLVNPTIEHVFYMDGNTPTILNGTFATDIDETNNDARVVLTPDADRTYFIAVSGGARLRDEPT